jgi:hypothetical protein
MAAGIYEPVRLASYAEASDRFNELGEGAKRLPEPDRRRYYTQLCHSTLVFIQ